jgi:hypothetical protein
MSTRAQIKVVDSNGNSLLFYRHSDGYPSGALPTLKRFMAMVASGQLQNNVEQSAGWLVMLGSQEEGYTAPDNKYTPWKVGAIEPACGMHGDIEYFYTLDLAKLTIKVQSVSSVSDAGNIKGKVVETIKEF